MVNYFTKIILQKNYRYFALTFFSIAIASFLFGLVLSISISVSTFFEKEGKTIIGGDMVLSSANPIDVADELFTNIQNEGGVVSVEYQSQVVFRDTTSQKTSAASMRIVDGFFPLYGKVETTPEPFDLTQDVSHIYVEDTFLKKMTLSVGDSVVLGDETYRISGVIEKEPDGISGGISFSPKVIMSIQDFKKSNIDLSQSRSEYKVYIQFANQDSLQTYTEQVQQYTDTNKIRFDESSNGPDTIVRGFSSVVRFIGIIFSIVLFLVVINILANLNYVLSKFKKSIAILKSFGANSSQIKSIYLRILGILGFTAGLIGSMGGSIVSNASLPYVSNYIQSTIDPVNVAYIGLLGAGIGLGIIVISALPFLSMVHSISPKELIKGFSKMRIDIRKYLGIPVVVFIFLYGLTKNITLASIAVLVLICIYSVNIYISKYSIDILYKYRHRYTFTIQSIFSSLKWRGFESHIVFASIVIAFLGVFTIATIEENILFNLNKNIPKTAPSMYIIDINKSQLDRVKEIVGQSFQQFTVVRGRLVRINTTDLTKSEDPGITREFSMTYRNYVLEDEKIVRGVWHGDGVKNSVSIDSEFAKEIGARVGDEIEVFVQGISIEVIITSIRETSRSNGTPFFYLVFSEDVLSNFPATYFGTISVPADSLDTISTNLGLEFPNITTIETLGIFETVQVFIRNIVLVIKVLGIPSIVLGLLLILIMTAQSLYERKNDVLIFRAFGYSVQSIHRLFVTETLYTILGASVFAYIVSNAIAYMLNIFVFDFSDFVFSSIPIYIIIAITVCIILFSYGISKQITKISLKKLLSEK